MTQTYPLEWPEGWPRTPEHKRRSSSPFMTTFDKARRELLNELRLMGAMGIVISSWLPIRNDGQPYADQARRRLDDPGCAVYFSRDGRQIVMARDLYLTVHDNLRSIGLAVEHLRGLERHGGAHMMERAFSGFAALPPPMREKSWREVMHLESLQADNEVMLLAIKARYNNLAKQCHPDLGGTEEQMAELNRAYEAAKAEVGGDERA